jgi:AcrR family transcriptional regulator
MSARQDSVEQTRLQITEATMRLHERVGPAATTLSAVAEEAGVTRLTVYRHFPDDAALIGACSAHWRSLHPRPDTAVWSAVADPVERLRTALTETYAWAHTAAPMMTKIYRDLELLPDPIVAAVGRDDTHRVDVLARGFGARGRTLRRLRAALGHALHVRTWVSLCLEGGLRDEEAVDLMTAAVLASTAKPAT